MGRVSSLCLVLGSRDVFKVSKIRVFAGKKRKKYLEIGQRQNSFPIQSQGYVQGICSRVPIA